MMGKLMVDSVRHLGQAVQGRRLPLRPDGPPAQRRRCSPCGSALDALTLANDGVDGKSIYLYGEGWNFGEVANNARSSRPPRPTWPAPASAPSTTGSATPSAAAARSTSDPGIQGFASGLYTDPNGDAGQRHRRRAEGPAAALPGPDQGRPDRQPAPSTPSPTAPARRSRARGRLQRPARRLRRPTRGEAITYVDAHDNETLYDALPSSCRRPPRWPTGSGCRSSRWPPPRSRRARRSARPGRDLLRSKSLDRN